MATRTITECDRCRREVHGGAHKNVTPITVGGKAPMDLCAGCASALDQFLSGRDLDVPP